MQRSELALTAILAVLLLMGVAYESFRGAGKTAEVIITHPADPAGIPVVPGSTSQPVPFPTSLSQAAQPTQVLVDPVAQSLLVYVNTATMEQLDALPGIGKVIAQNLFDYRSAHGPFQRVEDLLNVDGIGPAKLKKLLAYIAKLPTPRIGPNFSPFSVRTPVAYPLLRNRNPVRTPTPKPRSLNLATKADLMEIPGIGGALAEEILAAGKKNKGFRAWKDLDNLPGIGEHRLNLLKSRFIVP